MMDALKRNWHMVLIGAAIGPTAFLMFNGICTALIVTYAVMP